MKSVRPQLAVTTGVLSVIQLATGIASIVLTALVLGLPFSGWGFGGSIGATAMALFGIVGGFGRFRWPLILYALGTLTSVGFMLASCALYWQQTQFGVPLDGFTAAASALLFVTSVFGFIGSITGFTATVYRRRNIETTGPAYQVEEKRRVAVIRNNRAVVALAVIQMLVSIAALVIAAIDGIFPSWWVFGGSCGMLLGSIFGIVAGLRARRGMHMLNAFISYTGLAFTLVGVGLWFQFVRAGGAAYPNSLQLSVLSLGLIGAFFAFLSASISLVTFFMYRRRLLPTSAAYPTATATAAQPTVVVGEESAWQAPGISPRTAPAQPGQTVAEARTVEMNRFGAPPVAPTVPTRV